MGTDHSADFQGSWTHSLRAGNGPGPERWRAALTACPGRSHGNDSQLPVDPPGRNQSAIDGQCRKQFERR